MPLRRPRIAIDVRYLSHGLVGGVHTYQRNLVERMLSLDSGLDFTLWADRKAAFDLGPLPPHAELRLLPWSGPFSSIRNDRRLGIAMVRGKADLAHFPANYGFAPPLLPSVVTLHDAINIMPLSEIWRGHAKHPKTVAMMTYLHLSTAQTLRQQPFIITVSEHARREILRHAPKVDPSRVVAIYSAHEPVFHRLDDGSVHALRERYGLQGRIVLADAIKNPACTLRAWRALPPDVRAGAELVFFSRREPVPAVREAAEREEVTLLLRPERDDLVRLYNAADAFVFPSWYEGFGLPVLEAMACGAPVIASDRGSIPEVLGGAGFVVDAEDHQGIAAHLTALLTDPNQHAMARASALARAAEFSWNQTAQRTVDVYREVLSRRYRRPVFTTAPLAAGGRAG